MKLADRVVRVSLGRGADVSARAADSVTPLQVAAMKDAAGIVAALLTRGADVNPSDAGGQTPCTGRRRGPPRLRSRSCWTTGRASMRARTTAAGRWTRRPAPTGRQTPPPVLATCHRRRDGRPDSTRGGGMPV